MQSVRALSRRHPEGRSADAGRDNAMGESAQTQTEQPISEIRTVFTRSNFCRVIHSDGVWGGITPQRNIHMALFSERWALAPRTVIRFPESKDYPIDAPGVIEREIEADVILTFDAALFLRNWLDLRLAEVLAAIVPPVEDAPPAQEKTPARRRKKQA
jgi:hypothetical protein